MLAEVVFNLPMERSFHYLVPKALQGDTERGVRVMAPFGRRRLIGVVTELPEKSAIKDLKEIQRVIDPYPVITDERWELATWLSKYTFCSYGEALSAMVPSALRIKPLGLQSVPVSEPKPAAPALTLTKAQQHALRILVSSLDGAKHATILIQGVTGSGKTELYLRAIDHVLKQNRSAICLVPEIALTPQTIDRFRERFGSLVAIWHSRMTTSQRAKQWASIAEGACPVVVGTRSAVFSPLKRLGLIILDEEHERTYKQEETPRYHAREVARARTELAHATLVLGSATPSMESYHRALTGLDRLVELPERVEGRPMPTVEITDMREEMTHGRRTAVFSRRLQLSLAQTVDRHEQVMLLLNRRGFARVALCPACGESVRCSRCTVPMIYHATQKQLICHYCNAQLEPPELCPGCKKGYLRLRGTGTERVESELHRIFPAASIARMDTDTTQRREAHRDVYDALRSNQIQLLVGTQMIAKGFDLPQVTLVGVVSADTALNLPDFRAGERTFNLLTQVAGRAGRGSQPGHVIIQTYCPGHYAIRTAAQHDYKNFFEQEMAIRKRLSLPPSARLVELTLRGSKLATVQAAADALGKELCSRCQSYGVQVLGPAPHRIPRLRGTYRLCLLLSAPELEPSLSLLREVLQPGRKFRGMPVVVDVDPL